ncbi:MAG: polyprenyl synthetase family protein [Spirochaetaceae bacterium]|nr:MAG: polyprenyl synthetase family protein [Spirochaetaceae bacterium]
MLAYFDDKKEKISSYLKDFLAEKGAGFSKINSLGKDVCDRIYDFAIQGKMIRGGLVSLGFTLSRNGHFPKAGPQTMIEAGSAVEMFQSALLIHDDIMDRDQVRRGFGSVFYQYAQMAERAGIPDAYHLGESLGICAGDIAYFLAFEVLSRLEVSPLILRKIQKLVSRELAYVGIAQMQDIYWGASNRSVSDEEVLRLYLYKTGRYTFSLPLMIGGHLAEQSEQTLTLLEKIGEYMGIIFQLKDDEIGLFGDQGEIGKPIGSDIREGKKTLYYGYLQKRASTEDLTRLAYLIGNPDINEQDVQYLRDLVVRLGIYEEVQNLIRDLADKARSLIPWLPGFKFEEREVMLKLLDYSLVRTR